MSGDEMSAAMGRARLALAFHMGPHGEYGWQDSVSARSFEIPACGVPMLHIQNDQIAALFEPEKEYLGFADAEQLVSQIERALDDPGLRARLARNAFERAVPAYSYVERGREISRFLEGRLNPTKNSSPAGKA
jgi:spore maturation protein CgeB